MTPFGRGNESEDPPGDVQPEDREESRFREPQEKTFAGHLAEGVFHPAVQFPEVVRIQKDAAGGAGSVAGPDAAVSFPGDAYVEADLQSSAFPDEPTRSDPGIGKYHREVCLEAEGSESADRREPVPAHHPDGLFAFASEHTDGKPEIASG